MTDLVTRARAWRRLRFQEEYSRRVGTLQEAMPTPHVKAWLTDATIRELQTLLRTSEPSQRVGMRDLLRFLIDEYLHQRTRAASDALLARQQTVVLDAPEVDETVPLWQASARIGGERKRVVRGLLEDATTTAIRGLNQAYRELWSQLYAATEGLGYPNLIALWEEVSGQRLDDLIKPLEAILRETEDTYRDVMQWYLHRAFGIKLEAAKRHDILALFRLEEMQPWFPAADLRSTIEWWLTEWGWMFEEQTNLRLEHHTMVAGGAWCAPFDIPEEIRLLLTPMGGIKGFAQGLGEAGKALSLASFPTDAPAELRCFPDPSLLYAQAEVFEGLARDGRWVEIYRHVPQPGETLRLAHVERLFIVRRYIGKCLYERVLYEDPALDGKEEVYMDALRSACGFSYPEAYFLHDVEPGFGTLWRLRGWILSAHIRRRLLQQFAEEWFREPDALGALRDLWYQSPSHTLEALVQQMGGSFLDVDPVVADLLSPL